VPDARTLRRALPAFWWILTCSLLGVTLLAVLRRITWYLAVDQYGYLTFAQDLARGQVLHHWRPLDALGPHFLNRTDVLAQTYIYDFGRTYSRYAPGFPLLLAGWLLLFGPDAVHYLNPTLYMVLLAVVTVFQWRLFHSRWRATVGLALVALCPTFVSLWALTVTRDMAAHLAGVAGIFLLLPARGKALSARRTAAVALVLGYAASIRPDAVLYLIPASLVGFARWWREGARGRVLAEVAGAGALAFAVGLVPLLTFNWIATGNPFRPTQSIEVEQFFTPTAPPPSESALDPARVGYPPGAWRGGTLTPVQGGGLRLSNFPATFPQNFKLLRTAYGDLLLLVAVWGALLALVQRRLLFLAAVPYSVVAFLFFSCWARPDHRYLVGVFVFLPMLVVEGTFGTLDLVRRLARTGRDDVARAIALTAGGLLFVGMALAGAPAAPAVLHDTAVIMASVGVLATIAAGVWPHRRVARFAGPLLATAMVALGVWRGIVVLQAQRAPFQEPQMLRARATLASAVDPNAVVITSEDVGRPAENIDYYSRVARAFYLTDLQRWGMTVTQAAAVLIRAGWVPYLFVPPNEPGRAEMLTDLEKQFEVELVANVPPERAMEYFVAASFHPRGIRMLLYRIRPRRKTPGAGS
jgi:4-amino-4-deoxy-L-arabinose transferase-like glycosyltransferase